MARYDTAKVVINAAALETGLTPSPDPFGSTDPAYIQLRGLLSSAGQELVAAHEWNKLQKQYTINTTTTPSNPPGGNKYDLPDDFAYLIDQTGWTPTTTGMGFPVGGPLTMQDWTYVVATGQASTTIYVSFRLADGQFWILPEVPPPDIDITFEYMSRYWVADPATVLGVRDAVAANDDVVLYEPILIKKFLKLRFLEAKGFDTTAAAAQFLNMFSQYTGRNLSAPVLNMARYRAYPYLSWRNVPQTGFGLP